MRPILILTNSADIHADYLVAQLEQKGAEPFRINFDQFPKEYAFTFTHQSERLTGSLLHLQTGQHLALEQVGAVWARKPADFTFLSDDLGKQELAFAQQETTHILNSALYTLDCYWMNHPLSVRAAMWKGEQALRAAKMGFDIPPAITTNDPQAVLRFHDSFTGPMITKAMSNTFLAADKVEKQHVQVSGMPTTLVTDEMLTQIEAVREVPCYFQAYCEKAYELRITVIGDEVFAVKIDSQSHEDTRVDFRNFSAEVNYEAIDLPADIRGRCVAYVHSYQLQYGAIDLIVTPDSRYVFLENNPAGQFLFIEQLVPGLDMFSALADKLIKEAESR